MAYEPNVIIVRQRVLAAFGEFAIHCDDLDAVLMEACRLVGEATGTGRAKILELQEGGQELLVRAGVGWVPDVVGTARFQMSDRSAETYAIKAATPVISQDISTDDRFEVSALMKRAGVVTLVNVPIFVPGRRPYGVLQIDDTRPRAFGDAEIEFLRTYAMILGPVIDRLHLVEQRAKDRKQLAATETRHSLLVGSWAQAEWETDPDGVVIVDSPSWRAYTGQSWDELRGYGWLDAIHPDDRAYAERQWREAIAVCGLVDAEFRIRTPIDSWRWTNVRAAPVLDAGGSVVKWVGMNIDIDARKRTEERLVALQNELFHISRMNAMGMMVSTIAHELNQPLATIHNYIVVARTLVERDKHDPCTTEALHGAAEAALRAGNVIRNLRSMMTRREAQYEPMSLNETLREAAALGSLGQSNVEITFDFPNPMVVQGDKILLQQVVFNLIRNALEAAEGEPLEVTISAVDRETVVEVCVADTGPGIALAALPHIFDSFVTTKIEGSGIGLSICKTIVEAHGGVITAHNGPERGAKFCFTLLRSV